jgi:hypothetical protein
MGAVERSRSTRFAPEGAIYRRRVDGCGLLVLVGNGL